MKKFEVLLKKDDGTEKTVIIQADNAMDARWIGQKRKGVYEASVYKRVREAPEHLLMIGNMIKQVRLSKKMTQAELSEKANLRLATISDIESGKANVQINTLTQIATALNCFLDISLIPVK